MEVLLVIIMEQLLQETLQEATQFESISLTNLNLNLINSVLIKTKKENLLKEIIKNRDWAESERYNLKPEVDSVLKNSNTISEERRKIRLIFKRNDDLKQAVEIYLSETNEILNNLKMFFDKILISYLSNGLNNLKELHYLWKEFLELADIDNAHAMYLSSGTWDFSVFNPILDKLRKLCSSMDYYNLLGGGVKDIRTNIYSLSILLSKFSKNNPKNIDEFLAGLNDQLIDDSTLFLIFVYNSCSNLEIDDSEGRKEEYFSLVNKIYNKVENKNNFLNLLNLYLRLNQARIEYDIFEYFGYYAFARNLLIVCTFNQLEKINPKKAKEFRKISSLYQYDLLIKNLESFFGGN